MARIQLGVTVTGIRGTIGGITFSANKSGNYAKSWARGARTPTQRQNAGRAQIAQIGALWSAASPNETDYDPSGDQYCLSGFGWFTRAQVRRALVGLDPDGAVPSGAAATVPTGVALSATAGSPDSVQISWDSATFEADSSAILFLVPGWSTGAAWLTSGWLLTLALQNPGDTGEDISAAYAALFGDLSAGMRLYARIYKQAPEGNRSVSTDLTAEVA